MASAKSVASIQDVDAFHDLSDASRRLLAGGLRYVGLRQGRADPDQGPACVGSLRGDERATAGVHAHARGAGSHAVPHQPARDVRPRAELHLQRPALPGVGGGRFGREARDGPRDGIQEPVRGRARDPEHDRPGVFDGGLPVDDGARGRPLLQARSSPGELPAAARVVRWHGADDAAGDRLPSRHHARSGRACARAAGVGGPHPDRPPPDCHQRDPVRLARAVKGNSQ